MTAFAIRLFGELDVSSDGSPIPPLPSRSARHLLAFLVMNRHHPVAREKIAGALWRDRTQDQARKALRNNLWHVRNALSEVGEGDAVEADRDHVRLHPGDHWWVDIWEFEDTLGSMARGGQEIVDADEASRVEAAVELHRRPFMEGEDAFWCDHQRDRTRLVWLAGLEALVRYNRRQSLWSAALLRAHLVLRVDPLREPMHREVMFCHYGRGDRPSALAQYERLGEILREELGINPMDATRELRRRILVGEPVTEPHDNEEPVREPRK
ncbi:MAG: BTAD domain-containing putative transcriptional regulator [Longimicrobiales bacterium]